MKKDLAKTICKGCKELLEFEYGPSMGFNPDIRIKIVDNKDCDYLVMSDGSFQFEHKEANNDQGIC